MKIGRNQLCPCGSGKKYKKCCLLKNQNALEERDLKSKLPVGDIDDQIFLLNALNNMHKFILGKKPHIKEYKKIRKLHSEIGNNMMDYYECGKFERKVDTDYVTPYESRNEKEENKVFLIESEFNMETNVGIHAFQDMLIYKISPNLNCITEEFIKSKRYRKPEKVEFLKSMMDSKLGLFEITEIDSDEGYAFIEEVFTGRQYKITDMGLSSNKLYGDKYIYTRIITYCGVSFSTGINFVFMKTDPFIKNFIKRNKKDYMPLGEFLRFTELYNRFSENPNGINIVTNTF